MILILLTFLPGLLIISSPFLVILIMYFLGERVYKLRLVDMISFIVLPCLNFNPHSPISAVTSEPVLQRLKTVVLSMFK